MDDKLTVALGTQDFVVPIETIDSIKEDVMQVLSKYVRFQGQLNAEIERSGKEQEFVLIISGHVLFRQ